MPGVGSGFHFDSAGVSVGLGEACWGWSSAIQFQVFAVAVLRLHP